MRRPALAAGALALLLAASLAALLLAVRSGAGGETVRAQRVVESMGVNVHLSYLDTAYRNFPLVLARLKALGLGHVRDGACAQCTEENRRLRQLAGNGIRADLIMGSPAGQTGSLPQLVALVAHGLAGSVVSVEGANEYDNSGDPQWPARLRAYQRELYTLVKHDPALRSVPVLGPSFAHPESFQRTGDLRTFADAANLHSYPPSGGPPDVNVEAQLELGHVVVPSKPAMATETGYRTGGPPLPYNSPVSEQVEADYLPALYLEYFRSGIERTFLYELVDEKPDPTDADPEQHFGLLRNDFSPKPAYLAVRNLIAILSMGGPADGALRPPDGQARSLDGTPVHSLVAQRGDGAQVLAVWPTAPTVGGAGGAQGATHPVALELHRPASVELFRPARGPAPQAAYARVSRLTLALGADPVLAVIRPTH